MANQEAAKAAAGPREARVARLVTQAEELRGKRRQEGVTWREKLSKLDAEISSLAYEIQSGQRTLLDRES